MVRSITIGAVEVICWAKVYVHTLLLHHIFWAKNDLK